MVNFALDILTLNDLMKMKKLVLLSCFAVSMLLTSCGAFKTYMASYDIGLSSVESPADAKKQFGETKVVNFTEGELNKYRYEDDYINIVWYVGATQFNFELTNKSGHTIKINWDDISYVDYSGKTGRVMHAGVKYVDRNSSQPATSIPKDAKISDLLMPTDNVYYVSGQYGGWRERNLLPSFYKSQEQLDQEAGSFVGMKMKIMMPIIIENVQNDYTFEFNVDRLRPSKK